MSPNTNKKLLCEQLTKIRKSYPLLQVADLVGDAKDCQDAYYNAIQKVSSIVKSGDKSGAVHHISKLDITSFQFHIYSWDNLERRHMLTSSTYVRFNEVAKKIENLANYNASKIIISSYSDKVKTHYYFDLEGNAYNFPIDSKLNEWKLI